MTEQIKPALLDTAQAARYLGISKSHLEHNYRPWGIRPVRMGKLVKFSPAELDRFIARREKAKSWLQGGRVAHEFPPPE